MVPKEIADVLETDYLSPPYAVNVSNSSTELVQYFGHYSMANWSANLHPFQRPEPHCMPDKTIALSLHLT